MKREELVRFLWRCLRALVWTVAGGVGLLELFFVAVYLKGKFLLSGPGAELYWEEETAAAGAFAVLLAPIALLLLAGAVLWTKYDGKKRRRKLGNKASDHKRKRP